MHESVLLQPTLDGLNLTKGDVFVDATFGEGGHSAEVCRRLSGDVHIIGIDLDSSSLERAGRRVRQEGCEVTTLQGNFRNLDVLIQRMGLESVNKILFDLGWSSVQFEETGRGFSYKYDEPLLMTLNPEITEETLTAREIVNTWDEENIEAIIRGYGEERYARRIARSIVEAREKTPIETTFHLVDIIKTATPVWSHWKGIHPARRTFQALRIAVNDELESLKEGLTHGFEILAPGGRMAVITFHSLEDRIVKRFMREHANTGDCVLINKRPIIPSEEEIERNPRARSAKLRILEKVL